MYLKCRSCGLTIRVQATELIMENCPRCLARTRQVSRLRLVKTLSTPDLVDKRPALLGEPPMAAELVDDAAPT